MNNKTKRIERSDERELCLSINVRFNSGQGKFLPKIDILDFYEMFLLNYPFGKARGNLFFCSVNLVCFGIFAFLHRIY
jgi:hypothetical protein